MVQDLVSDLDAALECHLRVISGTFGDVSIARWLLISLIMIPSRAGQEVGIYRAQACSGSPPSSEAGSSQCSGGRGSR